MTREQIFKEVQKRLEELENTVDSPSEELLFFRKFVAENSFQNAESLASVDSHDALKAYLLSYEKLDYKKIEAAITEIEPLLKYGFDSSDIAEVLDELFEIWKATGNGRKTSLLNSESEDQSLSITKNNGMAKTLVTLLLEKKPEFSHHQDTCMAYLDLLDLYFEEVNPQSAEEAEEKAIIILNGMTFAITLNDVRDRQKLIDETIEEDVANRRKREINQFKRQAQKLLDGTLSLAIIQELYNIIFSHYKTMEKSLSKSAKIRNKNAQIYRNFLSFFAGMSTSESIKGYRPMVMNIPDEDLKKEILIYIYKYNLEAQKRTEEKYQDTVPNENSAYYDILKKYGILQTSEVYAKLHSKYQQEALSQSLESLNNLGITDGDILYQILLVSNEKTILTLSELAKKEIFPVEVLQESPAVFNPNTVWYKSAMKNIDTIVEAGINPRYLSRNKDVLFASNEVVRENIAALKESKLITSINKDTDISFIGQSDTNKRVALVSATNNTSSVAEDINLLNYDFWHWGRVYIMQSLSLPVPKEKLRSTLESKSFFISDLEIESYIFDESLKPGKSKVLEKELKQETASGKN